MGHNNSKTSSNQTLKGNTHTTTNQTTATNTINNNNCNTTTATRDSAATVVTVEEAQNNRIPISPVINLQIEESPTTSSHDRLSTSSSSSLSSVNTICGKQIIIKIQLAKMQNGNGNEQQQMVEQQQQLQNPVQAQSRAQAQIQNMPEYLEIDANSNPLLNGLDDQILNVTLNRNFICSDDVSSVIRSPSLSSSSTEAMNRTAGSIASSMMPTRNSYNHNNNNRNSCTATATTLHMERLSALQLDDELLKQRATEYCDFACAGSSRQMQTTAAAASADEEFMVCEVRDADNNNCCHQLNKSNTKSTSSSHSTTKTPPHRTSSKFTYRDALRRILEPSSSKSNKNKERKENSNKQQKQPQQHSNNSSSGVATCPHHHQMHLQQQRQHQHQHQETQHNSNNHLILQYPSSTSNTNSAQQPISIAATSSSITSGTVAAPVFSNNNNNNSMSTNQQLSIWSSNDVILPFNSPQVFVVCPSTSRVTLGHINDNAAIRVTTEILSGGGGSSSNVGQCSGSSDTALITTQSSHHHGPIVHSQVDFMHCLVPDLERIINSSFYWGKMDRYEAERLLEGKPEGTFLLRDSAQEEFLFSVTFRKYGRSLHARIEQRGHRFSFDCHDPGVFTAPSVTGLLEHYKDPACVMFFEPMLTIPFHRKMVFSLQQLARATIVSSSTYDGINQLELPTRLKAYLKEYHYKQKLRVKPFDCDSRLRYLCT